MTDRDEQRTCRECGRNVADGGGTSTFYDGLCKECGNAKKAAALFG